MFQYVLIGFNLQINENLLTSNVFVLLVHNQYHKKCQVRKLYFPIIGGSMPSIDNSLICLLAKSTAVKSSINVQQCSRAPGFKHKNYGMNQTMKSHQLKLLYKNIRSADKQKWYVE